MLRLRGGLSKVLFSFFLIFCLVKSVECNSKKCLLLCKISITVEPLCGSNGVTYQNIDELLCAKSLCYPDLYFSHNGTCDDYIKIQLKQNQNQLKNNQSTKNDNQLLPVPPPPPVIKKDPTIKRKLRRRPTYTIPSPAAFSMDQIKCNFDMEQCACDYILYPVCGSNGITYGNSCLLECTQKCDQKLTFHHTGFCGKIFFRLLRSSSNNGGGLSLEDNNDIQVSVSQP